MTHDEFDNLTMPYLAGALDDAEREAFEAHAESCSACATSLELARDADRAMDDLFSAARPDGSLEDRVIGSLRAARPPRRRFRAPTIAIHPMVRRAAVGVAAAILLGGAGFIVTTTQESAANRVKSAANLRQLSVALQSYANENKGQFPRTFFENKLLAPSEMARRELREGYVSLKGGAEWWDSPNDFTAAPGQQQQAGGMGGGGGQSDYFFDSPSKLGDAKKSEPAGGVPAVRGSEIKVQPAASGASVISGGTIVINGAADGTQLHDIDQAPNFSLEQNRDSSQYYNLFGSVASTGQYAAPGATTNVNGRKGQEAEARFDPGFLSLGLKTAQAGKDVAGKGENASPDADEKTRVGRAPTTWGLQEGKTYLGREVKFENGKPADVTAAAAERFTTVAAGQADGQQQQPKNGEAGSPRTARVAAQPAVPAPPPQVESPQANRKIIRNGDMTFEVDSYDSAVLQITKIAAEEGGFVATTESEKLPNGKVKGSVIVRVPPDRLDTLVLKLRGLGDLKSSRVAATDITKQYTDLDSQLRAGRAMEERLLEIIKSGKGEIKDLLEAEKQLGTWREKIEKLEGEIRYYNNLIALSTLTVTLAERDVRAASLLSESEQVDMGVEAEDVEKARAEAIKAIDEAKGRIVQSDLKKHDAGQFAATIVAEIAPDAAGPAIDRLKQLGRVARLEAQRRLVTAEGTGTPAPGARVERKETRLVLSIYNLANIQPRTQTTLQLAAVDVEKAHSEIITQVRSSGGRVRNSQLTKPTPDVSAGTIEFDAPAAAADALLTVVREAGAVLQLNTSVSADTQNVTDAKRGFSVQLVDERSVQPGETVSLQLAADDVPATYDSLLTTLREIGARMISSQINQQEVSAATATLEFDARRDNLADVEKALATAGGVYGRVVSRPQQGHNALADKVRLSVAMSDVDSLAPRERTEMGIEVADIAKAVGDVETTAIALTGRNVKSTWGQDTSGRTVARIELDVPLAKAPDLLKKARDQGRVMSIHQEQVPTAPDGAVGRARLLATFATADPLVAGGQSFGGSIRSGLATSVQWLLRSVTWIVIGLCLVAPWVLVLWVLWKIARNRKRRREGQTPPSGPLGPAVASA